MPLLCKRPDGKTIRPFAWVPRALYSISMVHSVFNEAPGDSTHRPGMEVSSSSVYSLPGSADQGSTQT